MTIFTPELLQEWKRRAEKNPDQSKCDVCGKTAVGIDSLEVEPLTSSASFKCAEHLGTDGIRFDLIGV